MEANGQRHVGPLQERRSAREHYSGCCCLPAARSQARQRYHVATERQGTHFFARRSITLGLGKRSGVTLAEGLSPWKVRAKPLRMP